MAAYFQQTPFTGFAKWMELQTKEELEHAQKFYAYLGDRNGKVALGPIPAPKSDYKTALEAFQVSFNHEQHVSASICKIYELAGNEKDYATLSFLKWFLDEQVEEEKNVGDLLVKLEMVGDNRNGLFQLDHHAGKRASGA
jgi:ferritin